ncbi:hypothetical protein PAUR_b0131 [Pseudoalteromonas aurantia 208]|uniref:Uncharacterized protein n=1 Tax=Pseudoalteromonas aurantia 208 TaxID=1314867 RepID=A0ABR9EH58_9GAMM|nr:hypothetical protein [Pseudoalteromonas aurantia 208]
MLCATRGNCDAKPELERLACLKGLYLRIFVLSSGRSGPLLCDTFGKTQLGLGIYE